MSEDQTRVGKPRRKRSATQVSDPTEWGPAWRSLNQFPSLQADGQYREATASLIADTLKCGHLTAFTSSLWLVFDEPDSWDLGAVSQQQAIKQGLALPDLIGPTNRSFALSPKFWLRIAHLEAALLDLGGTAVMRLSATPRSNKQPQVWELTKPFVSSLQLELLHKFIELGTYVPPKPKGKAGGRPRVDRWPEWTAHLIQYFMDRGFPQRASSEDFELFIEDEARRIIQDIERDLTFQDGAKLDSRDTMKTVIYALKRHYRTT